MRQITADFETFYSTTYSLTKMQTDAYILDDLYQTMGVAVKVDDGVTEWFTGTEEATKQFLDQFDWENSAVLCHHTLFDGFIFAQRFGIKPKLWMDTKSMATILYPYLRSYSLANLAKHFGLQDKGTAVVTMLGRRRESMNAVEAQDYGDYCINDVEITYEMGKRMLPLMPPLELRLIDMTVRMFTEPALAGNIPMLEKLYADELTRKVAIMALAGTDKDTIMSNDKFAAELTKRGVVPPKKVSPKTGKEAWAFAKTDEAFTALLEDEDPEVQALVAARLGVKTTIAETRALKMLETARRGALPVYLNYWGAKTTGRYSGGNQCLVGETKVHVLRMDRVLCIMLSRLLDTDLVWDGEEFVEHDGLVFQGYAEVITHDRVTGTEDHKVWVEGQEAPISLGAAAAGGYSLKVGSPPRELESTAEAVSIRQGQVYESSGGPV